MKLPHLLSSFPQQVSEHTASSSRPEGQLSGEPFLQSNSSGNNIEQTEDENPPKPKHPRREPRQRRYASRTVLRRVFRACHNSTQGEEHWGALHPADIHILRLISTPFSPCARAQHRKDQAAAAGTAERQGFQQKLSSGKGRACHLSPSLPTSAICCFLCALVASVYALWSVSMMIRLLLSG